MSALSHYIPSHSTTLIGIVEACSGAFLWPALEQAPYVYGALRAGGRRDARWGMLLLFLPCRLASVVSVLLEAAYVVAYPRGLALSLGKAALVLRLVALLFACAIFLMRVNLLWRNRYVWVLSAISQLALFGATVAELSQPFQESFFGHSDLAVTSLWIYLSTVVFTFSIIGIFGPQHRAHGPSARHADTGAPGALARIARRMDQEGMGGVAVCWVSSVTVSSVYLFMKDSSGYTRRILCYVGWLIFVHTACLQYRRLAASSAGLFSADPVPGSPPHPSSAPDGGDASVTRGSATLPPDASAAGGKGRPQLSLDVDISGEDAVELEALSSSGRGTGTVTSASSAPGTSALTSPGTERDLPSASSATLISPSSLHVHSHSPSPTPFAPLSPSPFAPRGAPA